jgi:hypothetical protein
LAGHTLYPFRREINSAGPFVHVTDRFGFLGIAMISLAFNVEIRYIFGELIIAGEVD